VLELAVAVPQAEQERARERPVDEPAEAADDAVGRALPLHLHERPRAGRVREVARLCDHAVDSSALELVEPPLRRRRIARGRREEERRRRGTEQLRQACAAVPEGPLAQVLAAEREHVECDQRCRRLASQPLDAGPGGVQPREERRKVEAVLRDDDDLTVEHERAVGQSQQAFDELGEVAREPALAPAAQVDLVAATKGEAAEAVPFRLVKDVAERQLPREAREHRLHGRLERKLHPLPLPAPSARDSERPNLLVALCDLNVAPERVRFSAPRHSEALHAL